MTSNIMQKTSMVTPFTGKLLMFFSTVLDNAGMADYGARLEGATPN
jgi:hypothetical protein